MGIPGLSARPARADAATFQPARMLDVELSRPLQSLAPFDERTGNYYQRALVLARLHSQPLGLIEIVLRENGLSAAECAAEIWRRLHVEINGHLRHDRLPPVARLDEQGVPMAAAALCSEERARALTDAPRVSVVVRTRDRPEGLATCLRMLAALDYPCYEVLVVDNASDSNATADVVRQYSDRLAHLRYVREDRPGGSWAHNRGLMEACGEIVAFTDDDVLLDSQWLVELVKGFRAAENVACVTGPILPAEIETPAQSWIEQYGGFSKGFARQIFDMAANQPSARLYPYTAGMFGSGANMAFKASVLRSLGGFDPALGVGSLALGGEDLAAYFQIITHGYTLVYEPAAIVYHFHRRDYHALRRQIYGYGVGLTAFLTKCLLDDPRRVLEFAGKLPYGLAYALSPRSPKNVKKSVDYPRDLTWAELQGMLYGPLAYLRSRHRVQQLSKRMGVVYDGPKAFGS
jgi:O-antigen biosynthesis protein